MEFVNHTPFPALAFGGVDQHRQAFHVVVMRQTLTWGADGQLLLADDQAPLCDADEFFGGLMQGSVRQESDLCQYKPRSDVIVNGHAHAPLDRRGRPAARFDVRLLVKRPDTTAVPPARPEGLNPWMRPSPAAMAQWQADADRALRTQVRGQRLIDKTLHITGARHFVKDGALQRSVDGTLALATLGLVRSGQWRLTDPSPEGKVPLRLERAFGGQCRIEADVPEADRVPAQHRLPPDQIARHPDSAKPPIAHETYAPNPVGCGFARDWFLSAADIDRVPAPQIEHPAHSVTLKDFTAARSGQLPDEKPLVAGLGVRPKGHPDRARLVGTVDQAFIEGDAELPPDFDFAVWNAAWPDQQADFLRGDETIGLINLCAADTPGAWRDEHGHVMLRLGLPGHLPFVLVRFASGALGELAAHLDTVIVDTDACQVSCVWRATIASEPAVRVLEQRMLDAAEAELLRHGHAHAAAEPSHG